MDDARSHDPVAHPYRLGYREGFRDGYAEAEQLAQRAEPEHEPKNDEGKASEDKEAGGDARDGDNKDGDDAKEDEGKGDEKDGGKDYKKNKTPLYKRPVLVAVALVVLLALIIAGIVFWRHSKHHESTDDAFVDGLTSQVAAQTAGRVVKLYVTDNQLVRAGDPLLDIDSRDDDARIAQSRAQLATAMGQLDDTDAQVGVRRANAAQADAAVRQSEAELTKAAQDLARFRNVDPQAVARQQVDAAEASERTARAKLDATRMSARAAHTQVEAALAQVRASRAQVEAARATVSNAELQGSYTHVVAPITGRVSKRSVEPGNVIATGQALMALVSENLWVTANYKETQLTHMQPGQGAEIVVDAYPDVKFRGHVDSIQRATGSYFSSLPAENATGNYVKVVQRVPVKIVFDDDRVRNYAIGPGMSVSPDVDLP
jgi:membrane fusion protein (multidrug efflux system)